MELGFLSEYYRSLIEISDLNKSTLQRENLINSLLHIMSTQINLHGVHLQLFRGQAGSEFDKDFIQGIDLRSSEYYLSNLIKLQDSHLYQNYEAQLFGIHFTKGSDVQIPDRGVRQVLIFDHFGIFNAKLILYANSPFDLDQLILTLLKDTVKLISNVFSSIHSINELKENKLIDRGIFDNNYQPMLLLDNNFQVLRINTEGQSVFSRITQFRTANLLKVILSDDIYTEINNELQALDLQGVLRMNRVDLSPFNLNVEANLFGDLIFKRIEISDKLFFILNVEIMNEPATDQLRQDLETSKSSLFTELANYGKLYRNNRDQAIDYGIESFFPAAFAFTINEHTGPLILSTSPKYNHDEVFEGMIKLLAGLNTNQIINLGYVVGSTPWSVPSGDLRWIAFYIDNEKARGGTEIHVIGFVAKDNLLMMKSELNNPLLGVLLGSMNQYTELITEDQADFVTQDFQHDMYFSTMTLIGQILKELRASSAELLAAYSLG